MRLLGLCLLSAAIIALVAVAAGSVTANEGPHGNFTQITDACAGCHRAHTAQGRYLLKTATEEALCLSCHGSGAAGAATNVIDGRYEASALGTLDAPLNAGGFGLYRLQGQGAFVATTSTHSYNNTETMAWGYGGANTGQTAAMASSAALECSSCHNPHGSTNYRILNNIVNGVGITSTVTTLESPKSYTAENWGAGMSGFCATCHTNYRSLGSGSGSTGLNLGGVTHYRHRTDMPFSYTNSQGVSNVNPETVGLTAGGVTYQLPLAESGTNNSVACTTCHLAHGSSAAQGTYSTVANAATTNDSSLLRLDNRGVCQVCHQK